MNITLPFAGQAPIEETCSSQFLLQRFIKDVKETENLKNRWIVSDVLFELFNGLGGKERSVNKMDYNKQMGKLCKESNSGLFSRREFKRVNGVTKAVRLYLVHDGHLQKTSDVIKNYKRVVL